MESGKCINMVTENVIYSKSYTFALKIIEVYKLLAAQKEFVLSKQLLRSETAIGALVREAEHAQSKADFLQNEPCPKRSKRNAILANVIKRQFLY